MLGGYGVGPGYTRMSRGASEVDLFAAFRDRIALDYDFVQGANPATLLDRDDRIGPYYGAIDGATWAGADDRLTFDGTNDFVDTNRETVGTTGLFCDAGQQFFVLVVVNTTAAASTFIARAGATTTARTFMLFTTGDATPRYAAYLRGDDQPLLEAAVAGWQCLTVRWNGSAASYQRNLGTPVALTVGAAAEEAGQRIILGARTNGTGAFLNGGMARAMVLDGAVSDAERTDLIVAVHAELNPRGYGFL